MHGSSTVTLSLSDNGGGSDTSATTTFTITVNSVNDPPTFTKGTNQGATTSTGVQTVTNWATSISPGPSDESAQTVSFTVTNDNAAIFNTPPAISPSGTLTYTPSAIAGSATVTVVATDSGGASATAQTFTISTSNSVPPDAPGAPTASSPSATTIDVAWPAPGSDGGSPVTGYLVYISPAFTTLVYDGSGNLARTATITGLTPGTSYSFKVKAVNVAGQSALSAVSNTVQTLANTAPSFTKGADVTVLEDSGAKTVTGWATSISAGPASESGQTLTFTATNDNNALFSVQPGIDGSGELTFTPAANKFGSATVSVSLKDNGGTASGGSDTSAVQTFTVTVTGVNDAPSFTKGSDQTVNEDSGAKTVTGWATSVSAGPNEGSQTVAFVVTNNNNALFSAQPAIDSTGELTFTPASNAHGAATVTVKITDNGGTANGGVDESATQMFTVTIMSVNDAPSFTKGADVTVTEDSGAKTVSNWATGISTGPTDEGTQTVSFSVSNNNAALFSSAPSITPAGQLSFTPAANKVGSATVTVTVSDNGGTALGGVDTSASQTFTVTVTAVNDPPSFTKGADVTVPEDTPAQTVANWATSISPGPVDEASQTVTFTVTNDNNGLFSSQPAIDASGTLTYTLVANANGAATVTVRAVDNGGGADTSAPQTFDITATPVNDDPSFTKGANIVVLEDSGAFSSPWATSISPGPSDESTQSVSFALTVGDTSLFSVQPSITSAGTLSFTPAANQFGVTSVSVSLSDNGTPVEVSASQTFTIEIKPVNDAPTITVGADQTHNEDDGTITVASFAAFASFGPTNEAQSISAYVVSNDNAALFSSAPAINNAGDLTYTLSANANGVATVTVRGRDDGGVVDGGVDSSAPQTFDITVTAVNDDPSFTPGADVVASLATLTGTIANWATNLIKGPPDESAQTLTFVISPEDPGYFVTPPTIDASGGLSYHIWPNASGTTHANVTLFDSQAGSSPVHSIAFDMIATSIEFQSQQYQFDEDSVGATLTLARNGHTGAAATVQVTYSSTSSDSATGNLDYEAKTVTANFGIGDATTEAPVPILEDDEAELWESFTATLAIASGPAVVGDQGSAAVLIGSSDIAIVGFKSPLTASVSEDVGTYQLQLERHGNTSLLVKARVWSLGTGSAVEGDDFVKVDTTVEFDSGVTQLSVPVTIMNNPETESVETIEFMVEPVFGYLVEASPEARFVLTLFDPVIPPVVREVSSNEPASVSGHGETEIVIRGTGFGPNINGVSVTVAGVPCLKLEWVSSLMLKCTPEAITDPSALPITGPVVVTLPDDEVVESDDQFSIVYAAPVIESVSPSTVTTGVEQWVTLKGQNFGYSDADVSGVHFGNTKCITVRRLSPFYAECLIHPSLDAPVGLNNVTILTQSGPPVTVPDLVTFIYPTPSVTDVSPDSVKSSGGTVITLEGTWFGSTNHSDLVITVGGAPCLEVVRIDNTTAECTMPPEDSTDGTTLISVTISGATSEPADVGLRYGKECSPTCGWAASCIDGQCVCDIGYRNPPACLDWMVDIRPASNVKEVRLSEDGTYENFIIRLAEQPRAPVTVVVSSLNTKEARVLPPSKGPVVTQTDTTLTELEGDADTQPVLLQTSDPAGNDNVGVVLVLSDATDLGTVRVIGQNDNVRDGNTTTPIVFRITSDDERFIPSDIPKWWVYIADASPVISKIKPSVLPPEGGTVTIEGRNFDPYVSLWYAETRLEDVSIDSDNVQTAFKIDLPACTPPDCQDNQLYTMILQNKIGSVATMDDAILFTGDCPYEGQFGSNGNCMTCPEELDCRGGLVAKPKTSGVFVDTTGDTPAVVECIPAERCTPGGCAEAYEGTFCGGCAPGYRELNDICVKCGEKRDIMWNVIATTLLWTAMGICATSLSNSEHFSYVVIFVRVLQLAAGVGEMSTSSLPRWVLHVFDFMKLFSADIGFLQPDCFEPVPFWLRFWYTMGYCVSITVPTYLIMGITAAFSIGGQKKRIREAEDEQDAESKTNELERLKQWYQDRAIRCVQIFLTLCYLPVMSVSFEALACEQVNGKSHLMTHRDEVCFKDTGHLIATISASTLLALYGLAWPCGLCAFYRRHFDELDSNPSFMHKHDFLYELQKPQYYWMFLLDFIVTIFVAMGKSVLMRHPVSQMSVVGGFILIRLGVLLFKRPFTVPSANIAHVFICVVYLAIIWLVYVSQSSLWDSVPWMRDWLPIIVVSLLVLALLLFGLYTMYLYFFHHKEAPRSKWVFDVPDIFDDANSVFVHGEQMLDEKFQPIRIYGRVKGDWDPKATTEESVAEDASDETDAWDMNNIPDMLGGLVGSISSFTDSHGRRKGFSMPGAGHLFEEVRRDSNDSLVLDVSDDDGHHQTHVVTDEEEEAWDVDDEEFHDIVRTVMTPRAPLDDIHEGHGDYPQEDTSPPVPQAMPGLLLAEVLDDTTSTTSTGDRWPAVVGEGAETGEVLERHPSAPVLRDGSDDSLHE
eukprot:TRINITY_DN38_c0_g1_i4.p1 TRINITY_DN38_c0_g1~~TRINITY_DN38_c0_g1_i4.p1  ORF type:complete len:2471 (-),score=568.38 TRINITY_DN38_c0_g1_i4:534-7946(-)